uniref:Uncharacterized protein n=1 Tax=Myotis myotis TaxID=51298 RepID=A0A7J7UPV6_MYOMY|nr:hypothetical protein mMyoMyo1_008577 [Myotis myotis]
MLINESLSSAPPTPTPSSSQTISVFVPCPILTQGWIRAGGKKFPEIPNPPKEWKKLISCHLKCGKYVGEVFLLPQEEAGLWERWYCPLRSRTGLGSSCCLPQPCPPPLTLQSSESSSGSGKFSPTWQFVMRNKYGLFLFKKLG